MAEPVTVNTEGGLSVTSKPNTDSDDEQSFVTLETFRTELDKIKVELMDRTIQTIEERLDSEGVLDSLEHTVNKAVKKRIKKDYMGIIRDEIQESLDVVAENEIVDCVARNIKEQMKKAKDEFEEAIKKTLRFEVRKCMASESVKLKWALWVDTKEEEQDTDEQERAAKKRKLVDEGNPNVWISDEVAERMQNGERKIMVNGGCFRKTADDRYAFKGVDGDLVAWVAVPDDVRNGVWAKAQLDAYSEWRC